MPLFSIVVPVFNRAAQLAEAIESVFAQSFTDYELIVVDDGSTDATPEVARRYGERVRLLSQPNAGPGTARNLGIAHAAGEYVVFLDSDDLWFPWTLESYHQAIVAHGHPALVMGSVMRWADRAEVERIPHAALRTEAFADYLAAAEVQFERAACVLAVRTEGLRRAGGFTTARMNYEDHDLLYRLGTAPGFVRIVAPVITAYRWHSESISSDLQRTHVGALHQLEQEREGRYPGGRERARERRGMILFTARDASWQLLRGQQTGRALRLYLSALPLHLRQPRMKYLLGFPIVALAAAVRRALPSPGRSNAAGVRGRR